MGRLGRERIRFWVQRVWLWLGCGLGCRPICRVCCWLCTRADLLACVCACGHIRDCHVSARTHGSCFPSGCLCLRGVQLSLGKDPSLGKRVSWPHTDAGGPFSVGLALPSVPSQLHVHIISAPPSGSCLRPWSLPQCSP